MVDLKRKVQTLESDNTGLNNKISAMERTIDVLTNELSNKVNRDGMKRYALESVLNNKISAVEQSIDILTNQLSNKVNHNEMKECVPPATTTTTGTKSTCQWKMD
eukprot:1097007_1